jgi:hydrogenase-4 component E
VIDMAGWLALGLAFGVLVVRRRSVALLLTAAQSLLVAIAALATTPGRTREFLAAGLVLVVRAVLLPAVLAISLRRTREPRRITAGITPLARFAVGVAVVVSAGALVPSFGLGSAAAEHACVGLVALGITTVMLRRPTLFQVCGLLMAENGLAVAAVSVSGGIPFAIELGIAGDLVLLVLVATAFHERIFGQFGSGNTALLRELRD